MANGDTKTESYLRAAAEGTRADLPADTCCNTKTQNLILGVANRIMDVEDEVEELKNNPDVVDIVATYADLQAYDTQHLTDNDIIRVLQDETHNGNSTYYRFTKNPDTWTFIGEISSGEDAVKTLTSADFNWNLDLNSATEPYNCVALWLLEPGIYQKTVSSGLPVAVHANPGGIEGLGMGTYIVATETTNPDTKQILYTTANSSRNWYQQLITVSNGASSNGRRQFIMDNNIVQTTGSSTTDIMSQKAVTDALAPQNSTDALWINNLKSSNIFPATLANYSVTINPTTSGTGGGGAKAIGAIAINGTASGHSAVAIGMNTSATQRGAIAIGRGASATTVGEMNIGTNDTTAGYNSTNYRLLSGVHDPIDAHDAATKGYVDSHSGGVTPVQTTGTSTTDVMSQNATTSMVFADPSTQRKIKIGAGTFVSEGDDGIEIGKESKAKGVSTIAIGPEATVDSFAADGVAIGAATTTFGDNAIAIGYYAGTNSEKAVALGRSAHANHSFSVALGAGATTSAAGEINVSTGSVYTTSGYNSSNYRLLTGLYDGQSAHDAVTVAQVNATIDAINTALSTNIPHIGV